MELTIGLKNTAEIVVTDAMCADTSCISFPGLELTHVFSTPYMINLMELTCAQLMNQSLDAEHGSVGMAVNIKHLKATNPGATVRCECEITEINGVKILFAVNCYEGDKLIGTGTHKRAVISTSTFGK